MQHYTEPNNDVEDFGADYAGLTLCTRWTCWTCYVNGRTKSYTKPNFFSQGWELEDEIGFAEEVDTMLKHTLPPDDDWIDALFEIQDA
jgi:hypothetical protein